MSAHTRPANAPLPLLPRKLSGLNCTIRLSSVPNFASTALKFPRICPVNPLRSATPAKNVTHRR